MSDSEPTMNEPIMNESTRKFVEAHLGQDVRDVALHARRDDPDLDLPLALDQIAGRRMARTKLPDWAAHERIIYPPHLAMEQCSSESTARAKATLAGEVLGAIDAAQPTTLVDLTGGFGVDFAALAPLFDAAVYVERQERLCELARHNFRELGLRNVDVFCADGVGHLRAMPPATMIFVDPARRDGVSGARTYAIEDCTPDVHALRDELLAKAPLAMLKLSPMLDWRRAIEQFDGAVAAVAIIATRNECKDLVLLLARDARAVADALAARVAGDSAGDSAGGTAGDATAGDAADIATDTAGPFVVAIDDGARLAFRMGAPQRPRLMEPRELPRMRYLYEPNAAVMKSGGFGALQSAFPTLAQVGANSHLFAGERPVDGFPGRAFAIEATGTMNKKELKVLMRGVARANVAVRNFPLTAAQLAKN